MTNKTRILEKLNILRGSIQGIIHSCVLTKYLEQDKANVIVSLIESRLKELEEEIERLEEQGDLL